MTFPAAVEDFLLTETVSGDMGVTLADAAVTAVVAAYVGELNEASDVDFPTETPDCSLPCRFMQQPDCLGITAHQKSPVFFRSELPFPAQPGDYLPNIFCHGIKIINMIMLLSTEVAYGILLFEFKWYRINPLFKNKAICQS